MSTIGYKSWAVDMADVGAMYPFQGAEVPMVIVGVVFWVGWHVIQFNRETIELEEARKAASAAQIKAALERY
ncbi:MAG: hypothetical protein QMC60_04480 [Amylibacter sp.]|jgi:hypothetical protein|tara:strand:+ start:10795 stop:11010 length:216 start_codon:yes stop_codon:yes gene_type:complete